VHAVAWVTVESPDAAIQLLNLLQRTCRSRLSAFELMNRMQLDAVWKHVPGRSNPLSSEPEWQVLIELSDSGGDLDELLQDMLAQAIGEKLVTDAVFASGETQRKAMWEIRHSFSEANKKAGIGLTTDCAVPISAVPAFITKATAAIHDLVPGMPNLIAAHLGDGNVHIVPLFSFAEWERLPDREATAHQIRRAVTEVAHALHGTFSAEHGIGRILLGEMAHYKAPVELALMHAIKQAIDPRNLFNPGRLLPPPAPTLSAA
jgi:FAD/FMN-containing dehydrogenase